MAAPITATSLFFDPASAAQVDGPSIAISVEGKTVIVTGAQGKVLQVISLTGNILESYNIESPNERVNLNLTKGCYILKVDKVVRKVSIQ
jgi:hypothetical protein